jgi:trk system potassium uptake protein TrkA
MLNNKVINDFNDLTIQNGDEIYFMCEKSTLFELLSRLGNDNDIYSGNIIIAGGGVVGEALCQKIIQSPLFSKNNLFMIELNPQRAKQLDRNLERVIVLNGSALESEILNEANIGKSAVFVSVMNSIENNILSSVLAKKMGVNYSIALSNNALYDQLLSVKLVDSIVNPETITISRILFNLHKGHIRAIHSIRDTGIEIIEAKITENCGIVDTPIKELILKKNIQILSIYRSNTGEIEFIDEDSVIKPGDNIILSAYKVPEHEIEKLFSFSINLF